MKSNTKILKVGDEFLKELKEIKSLRRASVDIDLPRDISIARITNAMVKLPEWQSLKKSIIKEPRKEKLKW